MTTVEVRDDAQAERLAFTGSPTYRVDRGDLLPGDGPAHAFQFDACRAYHRAGRADRARCPDADDLAAALRDAATRAVTA